MYFSFGNNEWKKSVSRFIEFNIINRKSIFHSIFIVCYLINFIQLNSVKFNSGRFLFNKIE